VLACDHGDGPGENEPVWQAEVRGVYPEYAYDGVEPHLTHIERADPLATSELQTLGRTVASAETELRLEAARIALPAIAGPDLGQQRTGILPEPLSETVEPAELPVYKMVRTHAAVTDLW
jgi:hypothetical protein